MKNILTFSIVIASLFVIVSSCSSEDDDNKEVESAWVYESGEIPDTEIISAKVTLKDNGAYQTGFFEMYVKNITYAGAFGKSDSITMQIDFPKDEANNDVPPRPAYNIKGSTDYAVRIKELYEIDDTPTLDWTTYQGKLRVNDELFEDVVFKPSEK